MCGIAGILTAAPQGGAQAPIEAMTRAVRHRGPDAGAVFVDDEAGVALGHRRLAILDLSERGAQPMHSERGRYVLTFNGEIYNHLTLRGELEESGPVRWRGTSDTETLLAGFSAWGVSATLQKAVGMFAFGLWDRAQRRLTLARDRASGEKPLYYGFIGRGGGDDLRLRGSELKRAARSIPISIIQSDRGFPWRCSCVLVTLSAPHCVYENIFQA